MLLDIADLGVLVLEEDVTKGGSERQGKTADLVYGCPHLG